MDKKDFRKKVRNLKLSFSKQNLIQKSKDVILNLESSPLFVNANTIMAYWSMDDEVFTHDFAQRWFKEKTILLPVIDGNNLLIKQFTGLENMKPDKRFGIPEPQGEIFSNTKDIELIIVPGVAFDRAKNRLGRGKAFYDRLLKNTFCPKAGICFDFQLFDQIPVDEHDIAMDIIVSENEIIN
jgi:5-formyltetrahydrofolate cyclo-ligase